MKFVNLNKFLVMLLFIIIASAVSISGCGDKQTTGKSEGENKKVLRVM